MTLRLDPSQAEALEAIARVDEMPVSEAVRGAIAAHIEARRADPEFRARLKEIIEYDQKLLARLVPESDLVAASAHRAVARAKAASDASAEPAARRRASRKRPASTPQKQSGARTTARAKDKPRTPGARASQVIKLVAEQPGITIPQLANSMNIGPNYLYRLLPRLEQEGKVRRIDNGWVRRKIERHQM
jgi:hypothetical protein